jgi:uncharacterized YigZ family protein
MEDVYFTIDGKSEGIYKEKGSKFIARAYYVETEDEIRDIIKQLRKEHHAARHHCYAYRLGSDGSRSRANDDGEPSSTAGKPILGVISSQGLTNVLIVVIRYFGGILLGTNGLINAYRQAASDAIKNSTIISRRVEIRYKLVFEYHLLNEIMHLIKSAEIRVVEMTMNETCIIRIAVLKSESERVFSLFNGIFGLSVTLDE